MNYIIRITKYIKPHIKVMMVSIVLSIIYSASNTLKIPLMRDLVKAGGKLDSQFKLFALYATYVIAIMLITSASKFFQAYLMESVSQRIIITMRMQVFQNLQTLSMDFFKKWQIGDIMARIFSDIGMLQGVMTSNFTVVIPELLTLISVMCYLVYLNWQLALITFIFLPSAMFAIDWFGRRIKRITGKIQRKNSDIYSVIQEVISSMSVVQSFTMEQFEIKKFSRHNEKNYRLSMKGVILNAARKPVLEILQFIVIILVIMFAGYQVFQGNMTAPEMVSYFVGVMLLINPALALARVYTDNQKAIVSASRVFDLIDIRSEILEDKKPIVLENAQGTVVFEDVRFRYKDGESDVLSNINLHVKPGEVIALVGASGSGKTTLVNLISRFYDVTDGNIFIDDQNIKKYSLNSLRGNIGIVPQEPILFSTTVRANIMYGKIDATEEELIEATKQANAYEFIKDLPSGFYTKVGNRGSRLSGGQRQRIAIARAILRNPRILLLDEATSALDTESERVVQDALDKLMANRTSFVVAHRLSTIQHADRIVAMENGKIVEIGKHDELINKENGYYKKLYEMQFSKQNQI